MAKIYTGAGHGGKDSGAVGNGRNEKDLNLEVTLELNNLLRQAGHEVQTYRENDTDYGLTKDQRIDNFVKKSNAFKADYCCDVHFNASGNGTGVEVYHSVLSPNGSKGKNAAIKICQNISSALGIKNRGEKLKLLANGKDHFGIVRDTIASANLIECAFIDNASDMSKYNARKFARAIAQGICDVYGGSLLSEQPITPPQAPQPQVDTKQVEIDKLKNEVTSLSGVIKLKDTQIVSQQAQIESLNINSQKQLDTINAQKQEIHEGKVLNTKLTSEIVEANKTIDSLKDQISKQKQTINTLTDNLANKGVQVSDTLTDNQAVGLLTRFLNFIKNTLKGS
jgi:hypothetical protein